MGMCGKDTSAWTTAQEPPPFHERRAGRLDDQTISQVIKSPPRPNYATYVWQCGRMPLVQATLHPCGNRGGDLQKHPWSHHRQGKLVRDRVGASWFPNTIWGGWCILVGLTGARTSVGHGSTQEPLTESVMQWRRAGSRPEDSSKRMSLAERRARPNHQATEQKSAWKANEPNLWDWSKHYKTKQPVFMLMWNFLHAMHLQKGLFENGGGKMVK